MNEMVRNSEDFEKALLIMDRVRAEEIIRQVMKQSSTMESVEGVVVGALEKIGQGWQEGSVALAQVYMSGIICEEIIDLVMVAHAVEKKSRPKIGIAVLEDHHQLGKRIVCSILRANGYAIIDYGHGVQVEELVQQTVNDKLEILLISTLMLPSALKVKKVIEGLLHQGMKTKVIAGGAPFRLDVKLARQIGVATVQNASDLPALIKRVVNEA